MSAKKYYVVWKGRKSGVFETWEECKKQVFGFEGAAYKSFSTKELAENAFKFKDTKTSEQKNTIANQSIIESIVVDGAWNTATGFIEYQGVYNKTKELLFKQGPFADGTNNIAEFLAIVHALAYCKQHKLLLPIYSDSRNAIKWVKEKVAKTNQERTEKNIPLFQMIERAEKWLKDNHYNNKVLKWETGIWGENPADFGRK